MVFPFFRKRSSEPAAKGKGETGVSSERRPKEPQTLTPPKPVAPPAVVEAEVARAASAAVAEAKAQAEAAEEESWETWGPLPPPSVEASSVVEEAAVLFANARVGEAIQTVENFLHENPESRDLQPWLLLFDLYQFQGMKARFEELSMEFAVCFERSAPSWDDNAARASRQPNGAAAASASAAVVLKGRVDEGNSAQLERLARLLSEGAPVRLDVAGVEAMAPREAERLAMLLNGLRKAGRPVVLNGGEHLARLMDELVRGEGRATVAYWQLLFELYHFLDRQAAFEDAAVDYAVTFEVSPPSWEPLGRGKVVLEAGRPIPNDSNGFALEGVIDASAEHRLAALETFAADKSEVRIDLSRVPRIDFVTVGAVLDTLIKLHARGKKVLVTGQNEMVHALLEVMGAGEYAELKRRKAR